MRLVRVYVGPFEQGNGNDYEDRGRFFTHWRKWAWENVGLFGPAGRGVLWYTRGKQISLKVICCWVRSFLTKGRKKGFSSFGALLLHLLARLLRRKIL